AAEEDPAAGEDTDEDCAVTGRLADRLSTRSNATALISTPAPKPMISPIARSPIRNESAAAAPSTSDDAACTPKPKASAIAFDPRGCTGRSGAPGFEPGTANLSRLSLLAQLVDPLLTMEVLYQLS